MGAARGIDIHHGPPRACGYCVVEPGRPCGSWSTPGTWSPRPCPFQARPPPARPAAPRRRLCAAARPAAPRRWRQAGLGEPGRRLGVEPPSAWMPLAALRRAARLSSCRAEPSLPPGELGQQFRLRGIGSQAPATSLRQRVRRLRQRRPRGSGAQGRRRRSAGRRSRIRQGHRRRPRCDAPRSAAARPRAWRNAGRTLQGPRPGRGCPYRRSAVRGQAARSRRPPGLACALAQLDRLEGARRPASEAGTMVCCPGPSAASARETRAQRGRAWPAHPPPAARGRANGMSGSALPAMHDWFQRKAHLGNCSKNQGCSARAAPPAARPRAASSISPPAPPRPPRRGSAIRASSRTLECSNTAARRSRSSPPSAARGDHAQAGDRIATQRGKSCPVTPEIAAPEHGLPDRQQGGFSSGPYGGTAPVATVSSGSGSARRSSCRWPGDRAARPRDAKRRQVRGRQAWPGALSRTARRAGLAGVVGHQPLALAPRAQLDTPSGGTPDARLSAARSRELDAMAAQLDLLVERPRKSITPSGRGTAQVAAAIDARTRVRAGRSGTKRSAVSAGRPR